MGDLIVIEGERTPECRREELEADLAKLDADRGKGALYSYALTVNYVGPDGALISKTYWNAPNRMQLLGSVKCASDALSERIRHDNPEL